MRQWLVALCCILIWSMTTPTANFRTQEMSLIPAKFVPTPKTVTPKTRVAKVISNSITAFFGQTKVKTASVRTTTVSGKPADDGQLWKDTTSVKTPRIPHVDDSKPQKTNTTSFDAGLPQIVQVVPLPLENSDHELQFNVSWIPYKGREAKQYSLEVTSITNTSDCITPICYEIIPGNVTWWLIPDFYSSIDGTSCAPRPGCAYNVTLKPDSWDRNTTAVKKVELEECTAGVCSCAHSPRLSVPKVFAEAYFREGNLFANINWTLPTPSFPQRLPKLKKKSYIVSIGRKKYVAFSNIFTLNLAADGAVAEGETKRLSNVSLSKPSRTNEDPVKLIARVSLMDERGCIGSTGEYKFDSLPVEPSIRTFSFGAYAILVGLIGAWSMGAVFVLSARVVKRVLKSFRPAPVSAPLEPLRRRPAWFPLQLRTNETLETILVLACSLVSKDAARLRLISAKPSVCASIPDVLQKQP